ncbi:MULTISPECIES: MBL fold metallo-hydrolase [Auritidibacter]|uniref:MBL fold metallo-hydrolase n=1 Tax=Auritidibacter ignavus TaxID=678932 RepID=A0AAJ6AGH5_9MICC|nr:MULTISPECIES: MBL fold metallo-hydrolase [Auritidibacter]PXA80797.1 MBL fold metallo-hydrolase [Auritidibacter sp. NML120779]AXR74817.1 MBL fold metallo-hydrolase [Auritidibacter sp. NML130574]NIH71230.1 glyoxylase-like metal-dependent hydrolase (beta-lactamase superfamily II) [Auritidibacter ignavus]PXA78333.1 MBL fold metallo-hydrolase [Auritidibacter sp. NML100628]PXA81099.1 MBL fold metallo-hydrolase [Auritidibacter sp. NML120636]
MAVVQRTTAHTEVVRSDNASGMTLTGTNTYLIAAPEAQTVVLVDPGEAASQREHLARVRQALHGRSVELIVITHHHPDHTGAVEYFHQQLQAPVTAFSSSWCRHTQPVADGGHITAAGTTVQVLHSPGHTSDSICLVLPEDPAVITGDTVLGAGTTMLDHPDGRLVDYLATMDRLIATAEGLTDHPATTVRGLPAHGDPLSDLAQVARQLSAHRLQRVEQLRQMVDLAAFRGRDIEVADPVVQSLATEVYPDVPPEVRGPAVQTVAATLQYLIDHR